MRKSNFYLATILMAAAVGGRELDAKEKRPKAESTQPQDQIVIESHITVANGPITRFVATRHYDRSYVYAEREAGGPVTLIDVTNPMKPQVLSETTWPAPSGNLLAVAGTAALAGDSAAATAPATQTIRLIDFSTPARPRVTKQFDGVTAIEKIGGGIILLANADGIWILSQHFAEDPAVEERYAKKVVYGESMY